MTLRNLNIQTKSAYSASEIYALAIMLSMPNVSAIRATHEPYKAGRRETAGFRAGESGSGRTASLPKRLGLKQTVPERKIGRIHKSM